AVFADQLVPHIHAAEPEMRRPWTAAENSLQRVSEIVKWKLSIPRRHSAPDRLVPQRQSSAQGVFLVSLAEFLQQSAQGGLLCPQQFLAEARRPAQGSGHPIRAQSG